MDPTTIVDDPTTMRRRAPGRFRVVALGVLGLLVLSACRPAGMVAHPSFDAQASPDFPSAAGAPSRLIDVRTGVHDGFDRVVLELDVAASWSVRLIEPPVRQRGSGDIVTVDGTAFLEVVVTPATALEQLDATGEARGVPAYAGPDRVAAPGAAVVTEVVFAGELEHTMSWVIGLDRRAPFAAVQYESPTRIVVDVLGG